MPVGGLAVTVENHEGAGLPERFDETRESPHTWHVRQAYAHADMTLANGNRDWWRVSKFLSAKRVRERSANWLFVERSELMLSFEGERKPERVEIANDERFHLAACVRNAKRRTNCLNG